MTHEDHPFVQKRFFEEYKAWDAVSSFDASRLLTEAPRPALPAAPNEAKEQFSIREAFHASTQREQKPKPAGRLTDAQWEERRLRLQRQAQELMTDPARF